MASKKRRPRTIGMTDLEIKIAAAREHGGLLDEKDEASLDPAMRSESERKTAQKFAQMSLPGTLGLPAALEAKRWKHGIVDAHFRCLAAFDKVHLFQISDMEGKRYGDTSIYMSDTTASRVENESPRGIITSAGIHALDSLRGAGIQVGDTIEYTRGVVSQRRVSVVNGKPEWSIRIYVGDVTGGEEAMERVRSGQLKLTYDKTSGKHCYEQEGESLSAIEPFQKVEV